MKAKGIIAAILFTLGLLICFSAAGCMDAGASWVTGAIRGAVGVIFTAAGAGLGIYAEVEADIDDEETDESISEWRDAS